MKRYNIISAGIGHRPVEAPEGKYILSSDYDEGMKVFNADARNKVLENSDLKAKNDCLNAEIENHDLFCKWHEVSINPPESMSAGADIPIRLGWDGSNSVIPNVSFGYCVHAGEGKIWLDQNGNDMNLAPDQQPTHWGPAMLPPGV